MALIASTKVNNSVTLSGLLDVAMFFPYKGLTQYKRKKARLIAGKVFAGQALLTSLLLVCAPRSRLIVSVVASS
jgi:hypothetical protein